MTPPLPSECSHQNLAEDRELWSGRKSTKKENFQRRCTLSLVKELLRAQGPGSCPSHSDRSPASSWFLDTSPMCTLLLSPGLRTTILIFRLRVSPGSVGPAVGAVSFTHIPLEPSLLLGASSRRPSPVGFSQNCLPQIPGHICDWHKPDC